MGSTVEESDKQRRRMSVAKYFQDDDGPSHKYTKKYKRIHTHLDSIFSSQLDVMSVVLISALVAFSAKLSRLRLCRLNVIGSISAKK